MKIKTKPYGKIEVDEHQRIHFLEGIIGFEGILNYFLLDSREGPFYWLQSEEYPELAFLIIDPRIFRTDYELEVNESDLDTLAPKSKDDLLDFAIVTVPEDHSKISANLMGPILINKRTRMAKQVISNNDSYGVKHYILEEMKKKKAVLRETG
jgi:flagellar assembly factor FliW